MFGVNPRKFKMKDLEDFLESLDNFLYDNTLGMISQMSRQDRDDRSIRLNAMLVHEFRRTNP